MFNITALSSSCGISICSWNINFLQGKPNNTCTIKIYYTNDTYIGKETNSNAWTLLGEQTFIVDDTMKNIDVGRNLVIEKKNCRSLYNIIE